MSDKTYSSDSKFTQVDSEESPGWIEYPDDNNNWKSIKELEDDTVVPKHFISAATIVLNDRNEILLIKGPSRGWEMPGRVVEEGELLKDAAVRETKEESGIDVEVTQFCGIFQNVSERINFIFS